MPTPSALPRRISIDQIARAAREIDPVFLNSPLFASEALGTRCGAQVLLKDESANPIRSFKGRGADFFVRTLSSPPARVVCASAGNFGQGLAYAAVGRWMCPPGVHDAYISLAVDIQATGIPGQERSLSRPSRARRS